MLYRVYQTACHRQVSLGRDLTVSEWVTPGKTPSCVLKNQPESPAPYTSVTVETKRFLRIISPCFFVQERHKALEEMGISVQSSGIAVEKSKFYLVNLNADPSMNELVVYYLKVRSVFRDVSIL